MRILVTGASGFIASQIITDLIQAGHTIIGCARNTNYVKSLFPNIAVLPCDFIKDTSRDIWIDRLKDISVVINCVGILYHPNKKIIWAIHYTTPKAIFDACVTIGIQKVIQISALGIDKSTVEYAKSKKAADDYLISLPIKSIILRPSLVYGKGSYGGTSLFRGLAGLPKIIPVPGKGNQEFQPIHLQDLAKSVVNLITALPDKNLILSAVSSDRITLETILKKFRAWLGFSQAKILHIPLGIIKTSSLLGSLIPYSAMNMSSYKMLLQDNITSEQETQKFHEVIGFIPRNFNSGIAGSPSTVQDRWHARLYFLKPMLQIGLASIWLWSGLCSIFFYPKLASYALMTQIGIAPSWQPALLYSASLLEAVLGIGLLLNSQVRKAGILQILAIALYSALITFKFPHLWLEPFASIAKNIPIIIATLILLGLESDR